MKAGVLLAKGDIRYIDTEEPKTMPGTIKIYVHMCGICGSDISRVWGDAAHHYPIVLGHEYAGEVVEIGEGVKGFKIGDRVAGAPLLPCMKCEDCQRGYYSQCKIFSALPIIWG